MSEICKLLWKSLLTKIFTCGLTTASSKYSWQCHQAVVGSAEIYPCGGSPAYVQILLLLPRTKEYLAYPENKSSWYFGIRLILVPGFKACRSDCSSVHRKMEHRAVCCGAKVIALQPLGTSIALLQGGRFWLLLFCMMVWKGLLCMGEGPNIERLSVPPNRDQHRTNWRVMLPSPYLLAWVLMSGICCDVEVCMCTLPGF